MSIECIAAANEPVAVLTEGTYVHKYPEPVAFPFAIQFGQNEGAIIGGTKAELLTMLERARKLVLAITPEDGVRISRNSLIPPAKTTASEMKTNLRKHHESKQTRC